MKVLLLLLLFLISVSSFSQVNDYYSLFNEIDSKWYFELSSDKLEKVKFGNFQTANGIEFHGVLSENNRIRFGCIKESTSFDQVYYYGLFNKSQFIGLRYSNKFDNFYKGIWVNNQLDSKFHNTSTKFYGLPKDITGKYIVFYKKGGFYYGNMVDGKRDGEGIYLSNTGYIFYGLWKKNKRIGNSNSSIFENGDGFRGRWLNDKINGFGMYFKTKDSTIKSIWKQKRKGIYNDDLFQIDIESIDKNLEDQFIYYLEYNVIITDDIFLDIIAGIKKEDNDLQEKSLNPIKLENNFPFYDSTNVTNEGSILFKKERVIQKIKKPLIISNSKSPIEKLLQILLPIVLFYFLYRLFKKSNSNSGNYVKPTSHTNLKVRAQPVTKTHVKPITPIVQNIKVDSVKTNYSETKYEKEIEDQFQDLTSSSTRILWVGDEHRKHKWSLMPGGSTVVVLYRKNVCRGYDKVKRPDAYTKKISRDYITNNYSNVKIDDLELYISEIYLAKQNSTFLKKVWHSNLKTSPWEILKKYRVK